MDYLRTLLQDLLTQEQALSRQAQQILIDEEILLDNLIDTQTMYQNLIKACGAVRQARLSVEEALREQAQG